MIAYYVTYTKPNPINAIKPGWNILRVIKQYKDDNIYKLEKALIGGLKPDKPRSFGISDEENIVETKEEVIEKIFELKL